MKRRVIIKKAIAVAVTMSLMTCLVPNGSITANAASKKSMLSKTKISVNVGKKKTVKLKKAKYKVVWKIISGKKNISIKKKGKYKQKIQIKGKKIGKAKIKAVYGKKKYILKVTVKGNNKENISKNVETPKNIETTSKTTVQTTVEPTTVMPTTMAPTTVVPTTVASTTVMPTTAIPTTVMPTTMAPTTVAPTTVASTTVMPTTMAPTTVAPTTAIPTTVMPTTAIPTTMAPTTVAPTTVASTTVMPTTMAPTTVAPTTVTPTTVASTTANGNVDESIQAPVGLKHAPGEGLPYHFAWAKADDIDSYNVYVDGTLVDNVVNGAVDLNESVFTKGSGEYAIGIAAVKGNKTSVITSIKYTYAGSGQPATTKAPEPSTAKPTDVTVAPTVPGQDVDENIQAPAGLEWAGNANLPYYFAWAAVDGADGYNVYIDGVYVTKVTEKSVNLEKSVFTKGSGEYTVGVAAVKGNKVSNITSVKYTYTGDGAITTTKAPEAQPTAAPTVAPTEAPTEKDTEYIPSNNKGNIPGFTKWTYPQGSAVTEGKAEIDLPAISGGNNYDYQLVYNGIELKDNTTYRITVKFTSTVARKYQVILQSNGVDGGDWSYANSDAAVSVEANKEYVYQTTVNISQAKNKYLLGIMMGYVDNTASQAGKVIVTEASLEELGTVTPTEAPTEAPTKAPEDTSHVVKNPGVQEEAADSQVASGVSLTPYFDGIDDKLSSTKGNTSNNEGIENLFDNNVNTKFFTNDAPAITIAWKMKRAVTLKSYTFVLAGDASTYKHRDPHSWAVYASMDGENWTTISDIDNGGITHTNNGEYTFNCTTQMSAQYFMIIIENSGDDGKLYYGSQMSEIYLKGDVDRITESRGIDITDQVSGIDTGATTINGFNSNEGVENIFDGKRETKLYTTSQVPGNIVWKMKQNTTLYSYTITTANDNAKYPNRTIKAWKLYGSTDGSNWELIDTVNESGMADQDYADYTYLVDKIGTYIQYKMEITELYGSSFQISDITLRGNSVPDREFKALFVGDWDQVTAKGYKEALYNAFYEVYPRQYKRWGTGSEPKRIFVRADKGYDGVAYTSGSSIVIAVNWMNNHPKGIGYFTHELTHAAQQYGNVSSSSKAWWVENMANYGGFRYYHWAHEDTAQVYYANDTSLQDWGYEAYGNNKWFFSYMDSKYPTTKDSSGNVKYGLIDSLNHLLKDNKGTRYDDNPYDTSTPWNQLVKQITGYDCIESLRLHYVEELKNGTWTFTGFGNYSDNWITTDLPGVPNIDYPAYVGKTHGNTTGTKLSSAVTSGTNLLSGATIISESGYTKDDESSSKLIDGNLSTKWCATSGSVENQAYALSGAQHFVKIDLGSTKTFNTYTLYNTSSKEGFGNTTEWEVLVSKDGKEWKSVDYQVNQNDAISSFNIGSQTARYIVFKIFNSDNGGVGTVRLYELQLYNR
ncbi:discoidin domain-containing protein [Eubacterium ventriosum]|uniref:discoidin domain-containing protein n=1 Tax=Eubacterium ventriosum TaxID=39496 RepID=UPI001C01591C|nr:discoidin domain-containing protein [Eubacterium ventriosum]MBT9693037.1 hypothetical protein [Eubacterium ventriosum]